MGLLARGANASQVHALNGQFALIDAASEGHYAVVAELLRHRSHPDQKIEETGEFALLRAAANGHLSTANMLLEWGACPTKVNQLTGDSAIDVAKRNGHNGVAVILSNAKDQASHQQALELPRLLADERAGGSGLGMAKYAR